MARLPWSVRAVFGRTWGPIVVVMFALSYLECGWAGLGASTVLLGLVMWAVSDGGRC